MTVTAEQATVRGRSREAVRRAARACVVPVALLGTAASLVAAVDGWGEDPAGRLAWLAVTVAWAAAAAVLVWRADDRLGILALAFCALAGLASLASQAAGEAPGGEVAAAGVASVALLPAVAFHLVLAGSAGVMSRGQRLAVGGGYLVAAGLGALLWSGRPSLPAWPLVLEAVVAAGAGLAVVRSGYRVARSARRRRLQWLGWGIVVASEIAALAFALHALVGRPEHVLETAALATTAVPLALALGSWTRLEGSIERLLVHTVSLTGLTGLVVGVYFVIVLGLGRAPADEERTLLVLSMLAAGIAALLYVPARARLTAFADELVHGTRQAADDVLRTFGARLSRDVPLEELLLQLAESLHAALSLTVAEIWTGSGGTLERAVSDPERGPATVRLSTAEEAVVARAGVSGSAWAAVWLPRLLDGRDEGVVLRVAPVTSSGELFGLIVVERARDAEPFDERAERVLEELGRRVGLALRNVRLDSELQASLEELRQQAEELRASRARVVAAGDAERRRIERDLHDGAQQYLVGLAVQLRLARELSDSDPEVARSMLGELSDIVQEAQEALRDLAHGIYPPLLQDRGLDAALGAAAARTRIPARVDGERVGRYKPDVETTVYFCCVEALQNAAKYAGDGARASIRLWEDGGALRFEVTDDGAGFDVAARGGGAGLTNMRDRLGAVGGALRVDSQPGRGTTVAGAIPLEG